MASIGVVFTEMANTDVASTQKRSPYGNGRSVSKMSSTNFVRGSKRKVKIRFMSRRIENQMADTCAEKRETKKKNVKNKET